MIEARRDENVNRVRDNINSIDQRGTDMPDSGADSLHEIVDNNDSPVSRESVLYPSSMPSQQHQLTTNVQIDAISITPTPQTGDYPSLLVRGQGHVELTIDHTPELLSPPRPNIQAVNRFLCWRRHVLMMKFTMLSE